MRVVILTGLFLIYGIWQQTYASDSIHILIVAERSFQGEALIGIEGESSMKIISFKDTQIQEVPLIITQESPFNLVIWEKRRLFFGYRKYRISINVYRNNEILVLDQSITVKKRYRYIWYWIKDKREIRTVINED